MVHKYNIQATKRPDITNAQMFEVTKLMYHLVFVPSLIHLLALPPRLTLRPYKVNFIYISVTVISELHAYLPKYTPTCDLECIGSIPSCQLSK